MGDVVERGRIAVAEHDGHDLNGEYTHGHVY